jgi:hypothetical protein
MVSCRQTERGGTDDMGVPLDVISASCSRCNAEKLKLQGRRRSIRADTANAMTAPLPVDRPRGYRCAAAMAASLLVVGPRRFTPRPPRRRLSSRWDCLALVSQAAFNRPLRGLHDLSRSFAPYVSVRFGEAELSKLDSSVRYLRCARLRSTNAQARSPPQCP